MNDLTAEDFGPEMTDDEYKADIVRRLPELLRRRTCQAGEPWTGDTPDEDHGHTDCWFMRLAANEIERLRRQPANDDVVKQAAVVIADGIHDEGGDLVLQGVPVHYDLTLDRLARHCAEVLNEDGLLHGGGAERMEMQRQIIIELRGRCARFERLLAAAGVCELDNGDDD